MKWGRHEDGGDLLQLLTLCLEGRLLGCDAGAGRRVCRDKPGRGSMGFATGHEALGGLAKGLSDILGQNPGWR